MFSEMAVVGNVMGIIFILITASQFSLHSTVTSSVQHSLEDMVLSNTVIEEAIDAAKEGIQNSEFEEMQLQEEVEDSKLDFLLVSNEVKQATQEAISIRTINQYRGINYIPFSEKLLVETLRPRLIILFLVCGKNLKLL